MNKLFNRTAAVTIGDRRFEDLRMAFKVAKTGTREPNTIEVDIYNLGPQSIAAAQQKGAQMLLEAGYDYRMTLIGQGEIRTASTKRSGADLITSIAAGDGIAAFKALTSESFAGAVKLQQVVKKLADDMGVGVSQALDRVKKGEFREAVTDWVNGLTLNGRAADELTRVLDAANLTWSIQDGALQILGHGEALTVPTVLLNAETGLVGAPEVGEKGSVKFVSLLNTNIMPGRLVQLESRDLTGLCVVAKVEYRGDTHGTDWYAAAEGVLK